ncbi:hypothetical protein NLD30_07020 [SCandidatus Aminicenantes bacterium Aminicenantia_JdfR_composite]|jgi:hypothetical protein|nr:hypothetical protein [SCandidatus Aminicenantes bacterium Aminicenantia_JdfR_composite]MCP2596643.1 hypothetical protein [Candidatus Aminicenantes bacterium AC-335-G13]MCP2598031.1 hypothetical protein [Candidatus Aminicenantes bacterium AC-335-L06]
MRKTLILLLVIWILTFLACIIPTSNVVISPTANLAAIKKIAVWKFRDGGRIQNSGDIATTAIESALIERGYRIVPYSQIREVLSVEIGFREGMALDSGMLTPRVLSRIKQETGVDAIIIGSVTNAFCDFAMLPPCFIEVSFKMVSTQSGEIIVSANASDDGYSIQKAAQQMAQKVVAKFR